MGVGNAQTIAPTVAQPAVAAPVPSPAPAAAATSTSSTDHSTTNIQVAGVDEADSVKTDGKYLYVVGNNSQVVYILDANPANAKVLSKIFLNNTYLSGIYLSQDGNKLAILGNQYVAYDYYGTGSSVDYGGIALPTPMPFIPYYNSGSTFVMVYDVSNKANPTLTRNFTITGDYVNSRLIGNYIYDIVSNSAYLVNGTAVLPAVFNGADAISIAPNQVYYANTSDTYYTYTTILSLNIMNDAASPANMTIMMGGTGSIYVSQTNIYVTCPLYTYRTIAVTTPVPVPTSAVSSSDGGNAASSTGIVISMPIMIGPSVQNTAIYRVQIYQDSLAFVAQGNVTGTVLNQYSMDESGNYFRIATTSTVYSDPNSWTGTTQNNLYVLDLNLKIVGKLENLASGENLYAARFMGNRCYLVTFNQIDPLFVVDLSQPSNPQVLGNLTLPGFSNFLQPYDATHLIGVGQDVNASIDSNLVETPGDVYYTAVQGLKISLFDVSDVRNPKELSSVVIGDRGTTSEALSDPKALLFDPSRNLLVLPVELYMNISSSTSNQTPTPLNKAGTSAPVLPPTPVNWYYEEPQFVWQGAYVFNVDLTHGIVLRGNVTQVDNAAAILANPSLLYSDSYQYLNYNQFITREVYIGNVLYTFSDSRVQLNALDTLALLAKIELS
ncbi:MAG TPA: beta-propeller domain-containing protein [Candidatus Nanoarchaeia archaeon]|nr:beta-propeller domain-containing protein [Candidatus Nanoarchaeia archaeon]